MKTFLKWTSAYAVSCIVGIFVFFAGLIPFARLPENEMSGPANGLIIALVGFLAFTISRVVFDCLSSLINPHD